MPSEDATSSTMAAVLARIRIDPSLFGQFTGCETVITKKHGENWLYILKGGGGSDGEVVVVRRSFDEFECAIKALDAYLRARETPLQQHSYFLPVLGTDQPDKVLLLGADGFPFHDDDDGLEKKADDDIEGGKPEEEVWQMKSTVPPRKRRVSAPPEREKEEEALLLIPGLKRLSKQLRVDFAINVHSGEGKRKRKPVRSIYRDDAVVVMETGNRKKKKTIIMEASGKSKKVNNNKQMLPSSTENSGTDDDYTDHDHDDDYDDDDAAELKSHKKKKHLISKLMESVSTAHAAALEAKDEIIRSMVESHAASITVKDKVIAAQAALIATLQEANIIIIQQLEKC